jgi:hypothetical protein
VTLKPSSSRGGGGGSTPGWLAPQTLYANKFQTIDPTQNAPGFAVPDGGTFKLSYGAEQTAAIQWDATAADVLAALVLLPSLTGKIALDLDDHTGSGAGAGPLPTAAVSFVLDDSLAPQVAITLSDNSLTLLGVPIDPWPIGVTAGYIIFPAFTPTTDDMIENFLAQVLEANAGQPGQGPQEIYLTDATLSGWINDNPPTHWQAPLSGVVDLNQAADDFTNFSGDFAGGKATSAFAADVGVGVPGEPQSLPSRCLVSVPLSWAIHVNAGAPMPGGVYKLTVQLGTVAP